MKVMAKQNTKPGSFTAQALYAQTEFYHCSQCPKAFQSEASLHNHVVAKHSQMTMYSYNAQPHASKFEAPLKDRLRPPKQSTFEGPRETRKPQASEDQRGHLKPFACIACEKGFDTLDQLNAHMYSSGHAQECSCEVCGKTFKGDADLARHQGATGHNLDLTAF